MELTDQIQRSLGELLDQAERAALAEAIQRRLPTAVRLHPDVGFDELPFDVKRVPWHARGGIVSEAIRPASFLAYGTGDYYIQDSASLLAVALLDVAGDETVCDLCAAPGGKSTAVLEELTTGGWLLANEPVRSRWPALQFNLARSGAMNFGISQMDPDLLAERLGASFDAVLVDAPCSGQSLVSRGKQTLSAFDNRAVEHCAARQTRILDAASGLVRPGGRLVYSTCTFSVEENEAQVTDFLQRHAEWSLQPESALDHWESSVLPGTYRLWPHRNPCGGAFAARLIRHGEHDDTNVPRRTKRSRHLRSGRLPEGFDDWGKLDATTILDDGMRVFATGSVPIAVDAVLALAEVAYRKHSTWFPSHALAMRRDPNWSGYATVELSEAEAARFLGGEAIPVKERGWHVAMFRSRPMGWLKSDGRLGRNHLPKQGRLRIT